MAQIMGVPSIIYLYNRLNQSQLIDKIVIATTENETDDNLVRTLSSQNILFFRGNTDNVLSRFFECTQEFTGYEIVVRITGDCPLIDPTLIDTMIERFKSNNDLMYLSTDDTFPDGVDVEVFAANCLAEANRAHLTRYEEEHVTPWIKANCGSVEYYSAEDNYNDFRITLDEKVDLEVIKAIAEYFKDKKLYSWKDIVLFLSSNPSIREKNLFILRNEGSKMSSGQKLWRRAKKVIPTGNHLLSKNSDYILPEIWPSYFIRSKGYEVWDLDNNLYKDVSFMGVGTNSLGYNNQAIDQEVKKAINMGNMSTLNSPEEVYLAEKLIELHPHFDQVRFARTGGEANAIAIRLARAASGKDRVAICGYHGWHDWYLATNLDGTDRLNAHLLDGLLPNGVPKVLLNSTVGFKYGDKAEFLKIISDEKIGTVIMEFTKSSAPDLEFIKIVREETKKRGIVLIFDECSTGFRSAFGGMHLNYDIKPDLAMFGKALGNGYAITAVLGIESIMKEAAKTFISSTFWTERIGFVAGLATLAEMEKTKSWIVISRKGEFIQQNWKKLARELNLPIEVGGFPAISNFKFSSGDNLAYKTYITQEMLKKGYLASTIFYVSTAHDDKLLEKYFEELTEVLTSLKEIIRDGNISMKLDGPTVKSGFGRLN
jgi:glutamate-1-semialdehyde 2,1-aminomutase